MAFILGILLGSAAGIVAITLVFLLNFELLPKEKGGEYETEIIDFSDYEER